MKLYKIQQAHTSDLMISINEEMAQSTGIEENEEITLKYGQRKHKALVRINSSLDQQILITSQIIESLLIDLDVYYEISYRNRELIIGPVIGLLLGKTEKRLCNYLKQFLNYTTLYEHINGVLFAFSEEQIDFSMERITGYVYDPNLENGWRKAVLPFPGAIYRRVELSNKTRTNLSNRMGKSFFNSHYFDKWQFWSRLSPDQELKEHLPETTKSVSLQSVNEFINKYKGVYLKPKSGSRGKGIHYIEEKDNQYIIIKNYDHEIKTMSENEMKSFLKKHSYYLLQEPIRLHTFEERKVDYRVILQKNHTGFWQCTGMIGRFGKTNAISSNFKANGFAKDGVSALMLQFGYDKLTAFKKYQEIIDICTKMAQRIDIVGEGYADLGIDVGIDENEKIWVIEMNKRHDHNFPLVIKDRKMYYLVKSNPVLYAKFVAMG